MSRTAYTTDLTDQQWSQIEPLIPLAGTGGRPRTTSMREVIDGILYIVRGGCAWRLLPHDFPCWNTVYYYFWKFRREGLWQKIHDTLRDRLRRQEGRQKSPSAAIVDSQSVKTTEKGGRAAMTPAKRSTAARGTLLSTRSD